MDDHTPGGERDVYNFLAAGPNDWVALHSLDLAPWNRGVRTEIDFVVIVPDTGILCIEVKSHDEIWFDGERWHPDTIKRSPFKQAADGRYTFRRRLKDLAPRLQHVPVVHCCIFPRAEFTLSRNMSVQPWELMDIRAFRLFRSGDDFCADLKLRMQRAITVDAQLTALSPPLSQTDIDAIVEHSVPIQKRRPGAREAIERRAHELESILRSQQKPLLQLAEANDRLVVCGGAGTGKTLIAMELARRASEKGRRVALLCFNRLVGNWMRMKVGEAGPPLPNLVVGRAIRVLAELTGVTIPSEPTQHFWDNELPRALEERLTDPELKESVKFDYLVLDEAQDVLSRGWLWQSLLHFVNGGLGHGSFVLIGDFENQVLGERQCMLQSLEALNCSSRPARWTLTENCRNYRIVGDTAVRLAGFAHNVYSGYMRAGGSVQNYEIYFYENDRSQLNTVCNWIDDFKSQGYKPSEITLLSFRSDQHSAASRLMALGQRATPFSFPRGKSLTHASVHAFKGLENKIIILTDVSLGEQYFHRDLFYTGMTRATESVRIVCDRGSQQTLLQWLAGASSNG